MAITRRTFIAATALTTTVGSFSHAQEDDGKYPMRFASNIEMWWWKLPFIERINAAADAGFDAIEFWPWRGKDIDAIAKTCEERGVEVAQFTGWGFVPGMNNPKNHKKFVAEIIEGCKVAKKLNCKRMTVVGGND